MGKTAPQETLDSLPPTDPNQHLHEFLKANNYQFAVSTLKEDTPYIESQGFVLTDKPLLVVSVTRKEAHGL